MQILGNSDFWSLTVAIVGTIICGAQLLLMLRRRDGGEPSHHGAASEISDRRRGRVDEHEDDAVE